VGGPSGPILWEALSRADAVLWEGLQARCGPVGLELPTYLINPLPSHRRAISAQTGEIFGTDFNAENPTSRCLLEGRLPRLDREEPYFSFSCGEYAEAADLRSKKDRVFGGLFRSGRPEPDSSDPLPSQKSWKVSSVMIVLLIGCQFREEPGRC